jgi:hypothetical protein
MDTIMTNVAYKVNTTNPNLPNGFIIDHFETDQSTVPGYLVVDSATFSTLLKNNVTLMRIHETNKGVNAAPHDAPPHYQRPASEAEPASNDMMAQKQQAIQQSQADAALFAQFMAWKNAQGSGS